MQSTSQLGLLRSIQDDELPLMLSWRNESSVRQNMYTTHEITMSEHLIWWKPIKGSDRHRYFMYEYGGVPLGIVGFTSIDSVSQNSSWAFYASPDAPKGTGSRMEALALDYAFEELRLYKLYCEVLAFNAPVIKLHKKFGFIVEGVLREQHKHDGEFTDIYRLGLFSTEWAEARNDMIVKLTRLSKG